MNLVPGCIDPACPINWSDPNNLGLMGDWSIMNNSGWSRGLTLRDLARGGRHWHDGTMTSGIAWGGNKRNGSYGSLSLDGVNDYAKFDGDIGSWWGVSGSAITYSCWVYPIGVLAAGDRVFMCRATNTSGTTEWFGIGMDQSNGRLRLRAVNTVTNSASFAVSSNVWTHIVGVLPYQSTTAALYKNGTLLTTLDISLVTVNPAGGIFTIGAFYRTTVGPIQFFGGYLDSCKVYNRALSAEEVSSLFDEDRKTMSNRYRWLGNKQISYDTTVSPPLISHLSPLW